MNDTDRQRNDREQPAQHLPEQILGYVLAVGFLTLTGPFNTYDVSFGVRLAYWAACIGAGWLCVLSITFVLRRLRPFSSWPATNRVMLGLVLASLPTAGIVLLIDGYFWPGPDGAALWLVLVNVVAICALIGGVALARLRVRQSPPAPIPQRNVFLDRLPPMLGTALISLTSQDHYVDVFTAKGHTLIHMRLADAIEELADYPGQQIHRSHWISGHAFTGTTREDGRLMAHLIDGRALPVSRSFAPNVRKMAPVRPLPNEPFAPSGAV